MKWTNNQSHCKWCKKFIGNPGLCNFCGELEIHIKTDSQLTRRMLEKELLSNIEEITDKISQ